MYVNGIRSMAWVTEIDQVIKHPNADALDICKVGGWQCVAKLGEFQQGDTCVYVSIDSWVPNSLAPFLSKGKVPREHNGIAGERLRTVRLRGEISQGLLLPLSVLPDANVPAGTDVSEVLNIVKYESPMLAKLAGIARGNFPSMIPKTDAERVQNINRNIQQYLENNIEFEVTLKLDGSSMTVANIDGEVHVCSRNLSLDLSQEGNTFVDTARALGIIDKIPPNIAIQGELMGGSIQKNQEKLSGYHWFVFEVYDIKAGHYYSPRQRRQLVEELGLKHVPVIHESITLADMGATSVSEILSLADGPSLNPSVAREGLVFKNLDGSIKFKAISNQWLLKNEAD